MNIRNPILEYRKKDHSQQHIQLLHFHKYIPYFVRYNRNQEYVCLQDMYQNMLMKKYLNTIDLP